MLGAMSSGHDGSLCTVHAGSPEEALRRIETLALMAGVGLPHSAIREQVAGAIDLVVHQARLGRRQPAGRAALRGRPRARRRPRPASSTPSATDAPRWRAPLASGLAAACGCGSGGVRPDRAGDAAGRR